MIITRGAFVANRNPTVGQVESVPEIRLVLIVSFSTRGDSSRVIYIYIYERAELSLAREIPLNSKCFAGKPSETLQMIWLTSALDFIGIIRRFIHKQRPRQELETHYITFQGCMREFSVSRVTRDIALTKAPKVFDYKIPRAPNVGKIDLHATRDSRKNQRASVAKRRSPLG